ncbi:MAG TPA: hypothetical protein VFQ53_34210 [Kofleriaceae bacterium]|nr:hypothetical protein [Kofleriaceae bacterium]
MRWLVLAVGLVVVAYEANAEASYGATFAGGSAPPEMTAGEEVVVYLEYRNDSTVTWDFDTRLGTQDPTDRASAFFKQGNWVSPSRPTAADHSTYAPGAIGRFTWVMVAPEVSESTRFEESFQLIQEGVGWFGPTQTLSIVVHPLTGPTPDPDAVSDEESAGCNAGRPGGSIGVGPLLVMLLGCAVARRRRRGVTDLSSRSSTVGAVRRGTRVQYGVRPRPMSKLHACAQVAIVAISSFAVACGGGDGGAKPDAPPIVVPDAAPDAPPPPPDAPEYDFSCMNNPAPTTAPATITVSGTANGIDLNGTQPQINPLDGATVNACKGNCTAANKLDTQTSDANGNFTTKALTTGGVPLDGYIRVTKTGYRTSNIFPPAPLVADTAGVPAVAFSTTAFQAAVLFLQVTQTAGNGDVTLFVTDCANTPIMGAQVTVKQGGTDVGQIIDAGSFGQGGGTFIVFDVPPGDTEVSATYNGMTLRAHTVTTFGDQTTATQIRPGF